MSIGFARSKHEYCLYFKTVNGIQIFLLIYVDDILFFSSNLSLINETKSIFRKNFKMSDMGEVKQYLGIRILSSDDHKTLTLDQENYIDMIAKRFGIIQTKSYATPMEENLQILPTNELNEFENYRNLLGSLLYVSTCTRPDVAYAVNKLTRYQTRSSQEHFKYGLRILQYLFKTKNLKLNFCNSSSPITLDAFVDSDHGADHVDRKSTTGLVLRLGTNPILWKSQKQKCVALASTHAEYYALSECVSEILPIKGLLSELKISITNPLPIYEDNKGARDLAENGKFCKRSKHIDIRFHFVHDLVKQDKIKVNQISSEDNPADILTKALGKVKFQKFRYHLKVF